MTPVSSSEPQALLARINELATSLVVAGANSVEPGQLDAFASEAESSPDAARIAAAAAERLRASCLTPEVRQQVLSEALADMRRALEQEAPSPTRAPAFSEDRELIADFLTEAREHIALIETRILELESGSGSKEAIHSVFRGFHTIKGLAGFLEFAAIQEVAHETETLLGLARNDQLQITPAIVDAVLESADYLRGELARIEARLAGTGRAQPADNQLLIRKLSALAAAPAPVVVPAPGEGADSPLSSEPFPGATALSPSSPESCRNANGTEPGSDSPGIAPPASEAIPAPPEARHPENFSVRVDTGKLDHLLEMVGEMVIAQSLIRNHPLLAASVDERLLADMGQLGRSTAEVQRTTMALRMLPVGQLFQRTARQVRDLSRKTGKPVALEVSGEDTDIDKTIAEELADPLLHMVRNAIDHGIETPEERARAGKPPAAVIGLKAYHRAGQIVIEVSDDGRGLNRERILAKAVESRIVDPGAQLSDSEICQLIFEPGFSTAEKVSSVSGRGVGMDVVRRNVQKLRGRIDINSVPGQGTTFLLRLPLTLAIIEALVVTVGASRYIIPLFAVKEIFRPSPAVLSTVEGKLEMALVQDHLLPILRLQDRFGIASRAVSPADGLLVVAEFDGKSFCLLVDDLVGKQEVVIKSLGDAFRDIIGLAGCAILGDGQVGLILDLESIFHGVAR
jgi:two-component system, chemotaxis family, sensor kinase CheA